MVSWHRSLARLSLAALVLASSAGVPFAPIRELAFLNGVGPRIEESGPGLIAVYAYSAPHEDLELEAK